MKKLLCILFALLCMSAAPIAKDVVKKSNGIHLTKDNLVIMRGAIDGTLVSKTMVQVMSMKTNHPILFISSPGGSIIDGMQFVQFIKDSGKKFTCDKSLWLGTTKEYVQVMIMKVEVTYSACPLARDPIK